MVALNYYNKNVVRVGMQAVNEEGKLVGGSFVVDISDNDIITVVNFSIGQAEIYQVTPEGNIMSLSNIPDTIFSDEIRKGAGLC